MRKHRKDTSTRARKPVKPGDIAIILTAIGTVLTGLAALLTALK